MDRLHHYQLWDRKKLSNCPKRLGAGGESYCSCPDFRKNTLGTCKHIIYALDKVGKKFKKVDRETPAGIKEICVYLRYGRRLQLGLLVPADLSPEIAAHLAPFKDKSIQNIKDLIRCIRRVEGLGAEVTICT